MVCYSKPSTFPDWILQIPTHETYELIQDVTPLDVQVSRSIKKSVHLLGGVILPSVFEELLWLGGKYLLDSTSYSSLILPAFDQMINKIRWAYYLRNKKETFDPFYGGDETLTACDYVCHPNIEAGFKHGRKLICSQAGISLPSNGTNYLMPASRPETTSKERVVLEKLHKFLADNKLLVLQTDKNLGTAVAPIEWYEERCVEVLNTTPDLFEKITEDRANQLERDTLDDIIALLPDSESTRRFNNPTRNPYGLTRQET